MVAVIIGSSIASKSAADVLVSNMRGSDRVIIITRDRELFYSRVLLPDYIAGELGRQRLTFASDDLLNHPKVRVIRDSVSRIDEVSMRVMLENNDSIAYDNLIIASGASPAKMQADNPGLSGIFCLRDLEDAQAIKERAREADTCAVLGGGLVSLKAAYALKKLGKDVSLVVESSGLLSRIADRVISRRVYDIFQSRGIGIRLDTKVKGFVGGRCGVKGILLQDGSLLNADMVVIGKGVRPNTDIVKGTSIEVDKGILVDTRMETSVKGIYAAGDVAQGLDYLSGGTGLFTLWPDAAMQGRVAASNLLGMDMEYSGGLSMNSVSFYGIPFITMGRVREQDIEHCKVYTRFNQRRGSYRKIVLRENRLIGAALAGDIDYAGMIHWDIRSGREIQYPERYLTLEGLKRIYMSRNP